MQISTNEAIEIYARACRAWYGKQAEQVAASKAHALRKKGDEQGAKIWERLVTQITRVPVKKVWQ